MDLIFLCDVPRQEIPIIVPWLKGSTPTHDPERNRHGPHPGAHSGFYRDWGTPRYSIPENYNQKVGVCNNLIRQLTARLPALHFWRHRGIWVNLQEYQVDGTHFNHDGLVKYRNSVRGAIITTAKPAMMPGPLSCTHCQ